MCVCVCQRGCKLSPDRSENRTAFKCSTDCPQLCPRKHVSVYSFCSKRHPHDAATVPKMSTFRAQTAPTGIFSGTFEQPRNGDPEDVASTGGRSEHLPGAQRQSTKLSDFYTQGDPTWPNIFSRVTVRVSKNRGSDEWTSLGCTGIEYKKQNHYHTPAPWK